LPARERRGTRLFVRIVFASVTIGLAACGGPVEDGGGEVEAALASDPCDEDGELSRTASCVERFAPGPGAGFGADGYPDVVYGEPSGGGPTAGSLDVLSLGRAGEIVVGFDGGAIVDGDGPDFIVFENAFYPNAAGGPDETRPFAELGEVAVSADGEDWAVFPCEAESFPFEGCAGWHAVLAPADGAISSFDPDAAGGDAFDLRALGVAEARFVRIRDLSGIGQADTAGFDLDAVAIVNAP
jgi:hypothetical protein